MTYRVNAGRLPRSHWTHDPEVGGGRIVGEVCHFVDLVAVPRGRASGQTRRAARRRRLGAARGQRRGDAAFADGSVAQIVYAAFGDPSLPKERIEVLGEAGAAVLDDFRELRLHRGGARDGRGRQARQGPRGGARRRSSTACRTGAQPWPVADMAAVMRATFAIRDADRGAGRLQTRARPVVSQYFPPEAGATQNRLGHLRRRPRRRAAIDVTVVCEQPNHPPGVFQPGYGRRPLMTERATALHGAPPLGRRLAGARRPRGASRSTARSPAARRPRARGRAPARRRASRPRRRCPACWRPRPRRAPRRHPARGRRPRPVAGRRRGARRALQPPRAARCSSGPSAGCTATPRAVTATTRPFCRHIDAVAGAAVAACTCPTAPSTRSSPCPNAARRAAPPFVVGYAGNLGIAQGLGIVLDAAERLRGDGDPLRAGRRRPARARAAGAQRRPARPRPRRAAARRCPSREVGEFLLDCHALLVPLRDHPLLGRLHPLQALRRDGGRPPGARRGARARPPRSCTRPARASSSRPRTAPRSPPRSRALRPIRTRAREPGAAGASRAEHARSSPGRAARAACSDAPPRRPTAMRRLHVRHRRRLRSRRRAASTSTSVDGACATRCATAGPTTRACGARATATSCSATAASRSSTSSPPAARRWPTRTAAVQVTYNGEIYNHAELRARARGARPPLPHRTATPRCSSTCGRSTGPRWSTA